ncbi:MAG: hypothetical protein ACLQVJ_29535 [Syntrophobacteraceae bacterium]
MALFKKVAIKRYTKYRTKQLLESISPLIPLNTGAKDGNQIFKEAVQSFLQKMTQLANVSFNFPFDLNTATGVEICQAMVIQLVLSDLSYDRSMGSREDIQLILETFTQEFRKAAS